MVDRTLEFLKTGELRELEEIVKAVGMENLEKLEELLDCGRDGLIEKGYKLTDLGKRVLEWSIE